jgi:hypothetical protein
MASVAFDSVAAWFRTFDDEDQKPAAPPKPETQRKRKIKRLQFGKEEIRKFECNYDWDDPASVLDYQWYRHPPPPLREHFGAILLSRYKYHAEKDMDAIDKDMIAVITKAKTAVDEAEEAEFDGLKQKIDIKRLFPGIQVRDKKLGLAGAARRMGRDRRDSIASAATAISGVSGVSGRSKSKKPRAKRRSSSPASDASDKTTASNKTAKSGTSSMGLQGFARRKSIHRSKEEPMTSMSSRKSMTSRKSMKEMGMKAMSSMRSIGSMRSTLSMKSKAGGKSPKDTSVPVIKVNDAERDERLKALIKGHDKNSDSEEEEGKAGSFESQKPKDLSKVFQKRKKKD